MDNAHYNRQANHLRQAGRQDVNKCWQGRKYFHPFLQVKQEFPRPLHISWYYLLIHFPGEQQQNLWDILPM
jgi:hypothetical protein